MRNVNGTKSTLPPLLKRAVDCYEAEGYRFVRWDRGRDRGRTVVTAHVEHAEFGREALTIPAVEGCRGCGAVQFATDEECGICWCCGDLMPWAVEVVEGVLDLLDADALRDLEEC